MQQDDDDNGVYRSIALFQAQLAELGAFRSKAWVREVFDDWVLQASLHLLMSQAVVAEWQRRGVGFTSDLQRVVHDERFTGLWMGRQKVPVEGCWFYERLKDLILPNTSKTKARDTRRGPPGSTINWRLGG